MITPDSESELSDMILVKPEMKDIDIDMELVKPNPEPELQEMEMVKPVEQPNDINMSMQKIEQQDLNIHMSLVENNQNTEIPDMPLVHPDSNMPKPDMPLISNIGDGKHTDMRLNNLDVSIEKPNMDLFDNIPKKQEPVQMEMVNISDNKDLIEKIQMLTSLDLDEIKSIDIEQLLSLADIIETTVHEIKDHQKHMKLIDNKQKDKDKKKSMKMVHIKQPPRNTFLLNDLQKVDQAAIDRAFNARHASENSDYSTTGTHGTAL